MLTFLFWNLKRARADILASLVHQRRVDIVMLAECELLPAKVLASLNDGTADYLLVPTACPKIQLYVRFTESYASVVTDGDDYVVRRIAIPGCIDFFLCVVHFPSKLRQSPIDQTDYSFVFARDVLAELEKEHARTIVVGDLNMNPFDDGIMACHGLHAVPTREIARKTARTVKFRCQDYFYNPMWRHFGERPEGHAGTYFFASPKSRADYWNLFDQVLVRAALRPYFRDEELAIIDRVDPQVSLLRQGKPDGEAISDHLPIIFRLHV